MSSVIPGGRPRSSSFGDILDESLCGALFINDRNCIQLSRRTQLRAGHLFINQYENNYMIQPEDNDAFESDSEISSQSQTSSGRLRRSGVSLRSLKKIVGLAFGKDSKFDLSNVWTPDLRRIITKPYFSEALTSGASQSSDRPLIIVQKERKTRTLGVVGIHNHGNTCFMNAILQCLSNTDSFTEYFIKDFFKNDLKKSTRRSSRGEVTEQLGCFLKSLWWGNYSCEVSEKLRAVIGKFSDQYKGNEQHDSLEFLLWLLDRIHEDVSTFTRKKVKSQKTPLLKPEKVLALEAAARNGDSFVLKLFQALHKNTLSCPTCGEVNRSFDPYLCLSLPLPQGRHCVIYMVYVSHEFHSRRVVKMAFILNQCAEILKLKELVAEQTNIPPKQLLLVLLKDDGFGATFKDDQLLSDIPETGEIYAFETFMNEASVHRDEPDNSSYQLLVMHVEASKSDYSYRFGSAGMMRVNRDITWKDLQIEILNSMEDSLSEDFCSTSEYPNNLFSLRICDGVSRGNYLSPDEETPLLTHAAERAYSYSSGDFHLPHIKLIVEWDSQTKREVVMDDREHIQIHPSVAEVQQGDSDLSTVSLDECFKLYTQKEKLTGVDAWLCPFCKQQQQGSTKTLALWSLPDILVLHLKRFKQSGRRRSKLNTLVEFPKDNLNMRSFLSNDGEVSDLKSDDYTFDLVGVSNHSGNMMGGHYTAYCRNPIDGKWREFNDASVRDLAGSVVATKEAYILFYQRRSLTNDIKQRLSSGDHWVFSIPHASLESTAQLSASAKDSHRLKESLRSASSSAAQLKDKKLSTLRRIRSRSDDRRTDVYSMTPEPARRTPPTASVVYSMTPEPARRTPPTGSVVYSMNPEPIKRYKTPESVRRKLTTNIAFSSIALKSHRYTHVPSHSMTPEVVRQTQTTHIPGLPMTLDSARQTKTTHSKNKEQSISSDSESPPSNEISNRESRSLYKLTASFQSRPKRSIESPSSWRTKALPGTQLDRNNADNEETDLDENQNKDILKENQNSDIPHTHKLPPSASIPNKNDLLRRSRYNSRSLPRNIPRALDPKGNTGSHKDAPLSYKEKLFSEDDKHLSMFDSASVKKDDRDDDVTYHSLKLHIDSVRLSSTDASGGKLPHEVRQNHKTRQPDESKHTSEGNDTLTRKDSAKINKQKIFVKHEDESPDDVDKVNGHTERTLSPDKDEKIPEIHRHSETRHHPRTKSHHREAQYFKGKKDSNDPGPSKELSPRSNRDREPQLSEFHNKLEGYAGVYRNETRTTDTSKLDDGEIAVKQNSGRTFLHLGGAIPSKKRVVDEPTSDASRGRNDYSPSRSKHNTLNSSNTPSADENSILRDKHYQTLPSNQNSLASFTTSTLPRSSTAVLENRYNFRPPRDVMMPAKTESNVRNMRNIPTPCLRESSI